MGKPQVTRRAIFLDRDGVLNRSVVRAGTPYPPANLDEFHVCEEAVAGCARLNAAGYLLIVITNQPDVGRGTQSRAVVEAMHRELLRALPTIDRIEVCYHAGETYNDPCACRKPKAGMIFNAAAALNIDLAQSYVIGDRWRDVDCAYAAGCRAIFLDRGYSEPLSQKPHLTAHDFTEAVNVVLREAASPVSSL